MPIRSHARRGREKSRRSARFKEAQHAIEAASRDAEPAGGYRRTDRVGPNRGHRDRLMRNHELHGRLAHQRHHPMKEGHLRAHAPNPRYEMIVPFNQKTCYL